MPNPVGINSYVTNFFSPNDLYMGVTHSINNIGGFQEFATISDRNDIPLIPNSVANAPYDGFTLKNDDPWSCGRRKVGMMVYVLETQKLYQLIPNGFFGNGDNDTVNTTGALGVSDWLAMPEWERAIRIDPINVRIKEGPSFENGFTTVTAEAVNDVLLATNDPNSCWVELKLGIDGNPISAVTYDANSGDLTITLTHDGSGTGTPTIANGGVFTVNIPTASNTYNSNLAGTIAMVEDVGGMEAGTLVSDINGQTYDQLFDTILFPTSYPTASQPSVSLTDTFSLREIGEVVNVPLNTTANRGQITLDGSNQGPFAGAVDSASISGPGGPYTLNVGPGATDIDNLTVPSHTVVEGTAGNQWTLTAQFSDGPMPLDSTGADYPSLQWTTGSKSNSTNFEGVYPIFLGNASNGFDKAPLVSHSWGVSVTSNVIQCDQLYAESAGTLYHRISIPNDMIDGRSIEVYQLNPVSGNYDEATSGWVQTADVNRTIQGNSVAYTLLTSSVQVTLGNNYRIKFV